MPNSRKRDLLYPYKDEARVLSKIRVTLIEKEKRIFEKIYIATCSVHTKRGNLKSQQSPSEKSRDYRDVIVFEKHRFQNDFRSHGNEKSAFLNFSGLKSTQWA